MHSLLYKVLYYFWFSFKITDYTALLICKKGTHVWWKFISCLFDLIMCIKSAYVDLSILLSYINIRRTVVMCVHAFIALSNLFFLFTFCIYSASWIVYFNNQSTTTYLSHAHNNLIITINNADPNHNYRINHINSNQFMSKTIINNSSSTEKKPIVTHYANIFVTKSFFRPPKNLLFNRDNTAS